MLKVSLRSITILGLDPGLATIGFGLIRITNDQPSLIEYGIIETKKKFTLGERLRQIETDLTKLIKEYRPELAIVEKIFFHSNQKTVIDVSQARGVIMQTLAKHHISIQELTPLEVKSKLCGHGTAEKCQIQFMVKEILGLTEIPRPDDAADALALAICGKNEF